MRSYDHHFKLLSRMMKTHFGLILHGKNDAGYGV